jgi:hypothetical protein
MEYRVSSPLAALSAKDSLFSQRADGCEQEDGRYRSALSLSFLRYILN